MKVGFTASAFDLLHAGHIAMLKDAKLYCDYLICGLHVDPSLGRENKNSPAQSLVERHIQLSAVSFVDEVIPYQNESDIVDIMSLRCVDVRVIGEEYKNTQYTGCDLPVQTVFNKRLHRFSSSELRSRLALLPVQQGSHRADS
tara:strand:- start:6825 stop:7253 length:429 start_codon:yes stop_codon:yes gene_type:complete